MDALDTIAKLINSPPGQLAAGGVLAGIVWKFFERVESVLNEYTKLEIAVWLLDRTSVSATFQNWPGTLTKMFERIFGESHLSWECVRNTVLAASLVAVVTFPFVFGAEESGRYFTFYVAIFLTPPVLAYVLFVSVLSDYISLFETRLVLRVMKKWSHPTIWFGLVILDFFFTFMTPLLLATMMYRIITSMSPDESYQIFADEPGPLELAFIPPAFFTSIWLWLYAGSGFLLKAARRLDIGFQWFNRHFDIETKPLQSIGLVAGAIVALVYWAAVIMVRLNRVIG